MVFQRINITGSVQPMLSILSSIRNVQANGLDLAPDYQRAYIWSDDYKDQLILSIILNYPIGNIVINNLDHPNSRNARQELVDGKQRLTTILRFIESGKVSQWIDDSDDWYRLSKKNSDQAKEIIKGIVGKSDPEGMKKMMRASRLSYSDLPSSIQMNFNSYGLPVYTMQAADPAQIRDYFKVLQNQEKLRAGEIIHAMPDNPLSQYFYDSNTVGFMEKISGTYQRADLEKIYYTMIGLWSDKILINSADTKTINFVENLHKPTNEQIHYASCLKETINRIANMPSGITTPKSNKRTAKLLFGLGLLDPDFYNTSKILDRVTYVCRLSQKLAAFNSSDSDDVSFSKYFGDEYRNNKEYFVSTRSSMYRFIYAASSRSTSKTDFTRAMKIIKLLATESIQAAEEYYKSLV